jgi:hypothetical protein
MKSVRLRKPTGQSPGHVSLSRIPGNARPLHKWDAGRYESLPLPHVEWGKRVVGRLDLTGDEHVGYLDTTGIAYAAAGSDSAARAAFVRAPPRSISQVLANHPVSPISDACGQERIFFREHRLGLSSRP